MGLTKLVPGQLLVLFFILILCVSLIGCATMYAPDSDTITINTIPEGAVVYDGSKVLGNTPLTHVFKRDVFERKSLQVRKQGYKNYELLLEKTLEKKALYNLVFILTLSGVTSWGIDAASGNMIRYSPDSYLIDLEKEGMKSSEERQSRLMRLRFVAINQEQLLQDIAAGSGEYLKAYYECRQFDGTIDSYHVFLTRVSDRASLFLSSTDPAKLFANLEAM